MTVLLASTVVLILLGNGPWPQYALPLFVVVAGLAGAGLAFAADRLPAGGRALLLAGLVALAAAWVMLLTVLDLRKPQSDLRVSLRPLQEVLDMSRPGDTYVGIQHWNPVFLMDADPKLFVKLAASYGKETIRELAEAIESQRPRFVIGCRTPVWTADGRYPTLALDEMPVVKSNYRALDGQGFVMVRRD